MMLVESKINIIILLIFLCSFQKKAFSQKASYLKNRPIPIDTIEMEGTIVYDHRKNCFYLIEGIVDPNSITKNQLLKKLKRERNIFLEPYELDQKAYHLSGEKIINCNNDNKDEYFLPKKKKYFSRYSFIPFNDEILYILTPVNYIPPSQIKINKKLIKDQSVFLATYTFLCWIAK